MPDFTYYIKVEARASNGDLIFESPEDSLLLSVGTVEYPTNLFTTSTGVSGEIKIFWDNVSGVDGYYVYYGETSQTYNTSGSPLDITDSNATQAIISGLTDSTLYYLTVEAYIGATESNNPQEVSAFPGTGSGSLVSAPAIITEAVNVGTNMPQKNLTITNNGGSAANVKFEIDQLIKTGGDTIAPSNYTITPASANIAASGNNDFTVDLSIPAGAVAGNYTGDITFYDDANSNSILDGSEAFVDVTVNIAVTGGGSGALTASPSSIAKFADAGTSTSTENVEITNNTGASVKIRFETTNLTKGSGPNIPPTGYNITPSFIVASNGGIAPFNNITLSIPGGQADGNYVGTITFYADVDDNGTHDGGEDFVDVTYNVSIGAVVDHVLLQSNTTSSIMGSPIYVTLTAYNSSDIKITTFQGDIDIRVSELTIGDISGSWHLSTNDGPKGPNVSPVSFFGGIGALTVDALEPETLQIDMDSITQEPGPLVLEFAPADTSVLSVTDFAIIGPSTAPTSLTLGAPVWIAAVDANGTVVPGFTGLVNFNVTGDGADTPVADPTFYTFLAADEGQFLITVKDNDAEKVTLEVTDGGSLTNSIDIDFIGVTQYIVIGEGSYPTFDGQGTTMNFTIRAADGTGGTGNPIRSYNKTATATITDGTTGDAFLSGGNNIQFVDGIAEIVLNNNQVGEAIIFNIKEDDDNSILTGNITANFVASEGDAPQIVRVEMDTPWIVHIYFNEDIDSATGGEEGNYQVSGAFGNTIDKVCWYGDNVTLNLTAIPAALGSTFNLAIKLVQDTSGAAIADDPGISFSNIPIPDVDFQGAAGAADDWFEIQASNSPSGTGGEIIHITVYHKNICGYLSGSNATNKNSDVSSITIEYTGEGGRLSVFPTNPSFSNGRADFDITIANSPTSGAFTIEATGGSPPVLTTQILTLSIP